MNKYLNCSRLLISFLADIEIIEDVAEVTTEDEDTRDSQGDIIIKEPATPIIKIDDTVCLKK